MRLGEASADDVLRNVGNSAYYRYVRPEDERVRIRPLELFPNGLLIEKPTDTIVQGRIEVELVGHWTLDMLITGRGKSRRSYEQERERLEERLVGLEQESRRVLPRLLGSHKNKVNAVRARLSVLEHGLEDRGSARPDDAGAAEPLVRWRLKDAVLLPSGRAGMVVGYLPTSTSSTMLASVLVRGTTTALDVVAVDQTCLQPLQSRHLASV